MLALQKTEPAFGAVLNDVKEPDLPDGYVMVEVSAVGICGSDIHMYEWTSGYEWLIPALPVTMGHEFAGRVVRHGPGASAPAVGQTVVVMPGATCMACEACRERRFDLCKNRKGIGLSADGGFARFVAVPARNCLPVDPSLPAHVAALAEPLVVGDRAVSFGDVEPGQDVVVLGPGIIGLAAAYVAKRQGAGSVTVVGKADPVRLEVARKIGVDRTVDLADGGGETLAERIDAMSVDRVFEATGYGESITQGLGLLKDYGIMVAIGIHAAPAEIDVTPFVRRKLQLRGAHGGGEDSWERVLAMLPDAADDLAHIVTHQMPLSEGVEGFEMNRRREACKVILRPDLDQGASA